MTQTPFHLRDNYRPVHDELTAYDLPVTGAVPPALTGWYLRNGPNPRGVSGHWFTGEGMIHGVRLEHGRAAWYRNRWVRTKSFTGGGDLYRPDGSRDLTMSLANTHVVNHAGHTLALVESSLPYEIDRDLHTLGPYDFGGRLADSMTAHPKICATTGELHFFGYGSLTAPYVNYHRADAGGVLTVNRPIDVPGHTMMHDFQLTANYVIFMDLPVVFDMGLARRGGAMPFRWDEGYGARLGVLRRDDPYGAVRWFSIDPCYVFHTLNGFDDGDRIVMDVLRYPHLWRCSDKSDATLWRWTIDLSAGSVTEQQCDDRPGEFPRIDDRLTGLDARFGHVTASADVESGRSSAIVRYDRHSGAQQAHTFEAGQTPAEAVFVPADDRRDGDGWLLTYVYDAATDSSDLVILDTTDLAGKPIAAIHLPARVPYGFHGNWIPEA